VSGAYRASFGRAASKQPLRRNNNPANDEWFLGSTQLYLVHLLEYRVQQIVATTQIIFDVSFGLQALLRIIRLFSRQRGHRAIEVGHPRHQHLQLSPRVSKQREIAGALQDLIREPKPIMPIA
jgi:hypothetical protein